MNSSFLKAFILVFTSGWVINGLEPDKITILILGGGFSGALPMVWLYSSTLISFLSSFSRNTIASGHLKWARSVGDSYVPGALCQSTIGLGTIGSCSPK